MTSAQKPFHSMERELEYQKHLRRIDTILSNHKMKQCHWSSRPTFARSNKGGISQENERLANKIISISRRKSSSHSVVSLPSKVPVGRSEKQRKIAIQNSHLAQRLMSKQSQFSRTKMMKGVKKYERIKKSMLKNRRIQLQYSSSTTLDPQSLSIG